MHLKGFFKFNRTFLGIFAAIFACALFATLLISSMLYINFENSSIDLLNNSNMHILSQISNSLNHIDEAANDFGISMLMNNDAKVLLYSSNDIFLESNSFDKVNKIAHSFPYLHSLYLYNSSSGYYYSTFSSPFNTNESFFDKEIISIIENHPNEKTRLFPRKILRPLLTNTISSNIYTFIFYDKTITGSAKNDAVIVNINANWLTSEINSLNAFDNLAANMNTVFIINNKGIIVSHPDEKLFLKDVSNELYIQKILSNKSEGMGYFIDTIDNQKNIISFVSSSVIPEWTFISISPYESITKQLSSIKATTLITCLFMLLFCFIIAFILSKFAYSPINNLAKNIRKEVFSSDKKDFDDIRFISNSFIQTISKANHLENYKKNSFIYLAQDTLKNILFNILCNIEEIELKFKEYMIPIKPNANLQLIIFKIDHYSSFLMKYNEKDQKLMKFAIQNIATEILSKNYIACTVDMVSDHIVALINIIPTMAGNDSKIEDQIISCLEAIQLNCLQHLDLTVSAFIGILLPNISEINASYKETLELSNYRLLYGNNCIVFADKINEIAFNIYDYPYEKQNLLMNELKSGRKEQVFELFSNISQSISKFSYSDIILSYTIFASNIFNAINTIKNNNIIDLKLDFPTFNKDINNSETIEGINKLFYDLFDYIINKLIYFKDSKSEIIVNNIIEIINNNYSDINLSLESIADQLKMSPNHIGKIFREHNSSSIPDYISCVRLEKAIYLLKNSNYSINQISDKIGYSSNKYFFKVFKKVYGVTPGLFRLKNSISNLNDN